MTAKTALIVDDSKSARVVLSRLLAKHDLLVETRDSAEAALEYLESQRPDVIFMDHVMPGMDGLSAVQLIKKDPSLSSIPVVMYTSQDGAIYADAAKASGADGILAKQMSPSDIADALVRLKLVTARPVAVPDPVPSAATTAPATAPVVPPAPTLGELRGLIEPLLREQGGDFRLHLSAQLEAQAGRTIADVGRETRLLAEEIVRRLTPPPPEPPPPPPKPWGLRVALGSAVLLAIGLAVLAGIEHAALVAARATVERQTAALAAQPVSPPAATNVRWPSERHVLGYGDAPFGPARIAQADAWLKALEQAGFAGEARLIVSLADFCLTGNPGEGFAIAPGEMAATACDLRGSPPDDARTAGDREPAALRAVLQAVAGRTQGEITAKVVYVKAAAPAQSGLSAREWNEAAAKGHFVEFVAAARAP